MLGIANRISEQIEISNESFWLCLTAGGVTELINNGAAITHQKLTLIKSSD